MKESKVLSVKVSSIELENINKIMEQYPEKTISDILRDGLWLVFDALLTKNDKMLPRGVFEYEIRSIVKDILKEEML